MAFNIADLFGIPAMSRMLTPQPNAQGIQGFAQQPQQVAPPPQQQQADPWAGLREDSIPGSLMPKRPDPMTTGATGQPQEKGFWDKSKDFWNGDRGQWLIDMGTGMAMGKDPMQSLALGVQMASGTQNERGQVNQTVEWLKKQGYGAEEASFIAGNKSALQNVLNMQAEAKDPSKQLDMQYKQAQLQAMQNPTAKLTDDQREYEAARQQGFDGTFMDYQVKMKEAGRQQVNIDTGVKLPSGYQWIDPNDQSKGVAPIPGGPATTLPAELAARTGLGENWLKNDLPAIRESVKDGNATGPVDRLQAWAGYGKPAEVQRKFQSGVEVLSRLLSGAGMTQVEIDEKTQRYMPTLADDPASLKTKIDQLEAEIRAAGNAAMRGRGGEIAAPKNDDPLGLR